MPSLFHRHQATAAAACLAICVPSFSVAAQDFFPNDPVARVIDLKQDVGQAASDFTGGVRATANNVADAIQNQTQVVGERLAENPIASQFQIRSATVSPSDVDFEVIKDAQPETADGAPDSISKVTSADVSESFSGQETGSSQMVAEDTQSDRNRTAQTPIVTVEIDSAQTVNVNEPTSVRVRLRNAGSSSVEQIAFSVAIPKHAKYISARPTPTKHEKNMLHFEVDGLASNQEREIVFQVIPTTKRPLDFATRLQVIENQKTRVAVQQPELQLNVQGPSQINIGGKTTHVVQIENVGDGVARQVRLQGNFPDELRFLDQQGMSAPKDIAPGDSLTVTINSLATLPGIVKMEFMAEGDKVTAKPAASSLKITQPELKVLAVGPNMNFVDRNGIYSIKVDNSGEVDVTDVTVSLAIPDGMEVTTINRAAKLDKVTKSLVWKFDTIAANSTETIQLKAINDRAGQQVCRIQVTSKETKRSEFTLKTDIASRADLSISMSNSSGPVQVGDQALFDVTVVNKGSDSASGVEVTIELPASLMAVKQDSLIVNEGANTVTFRNSHIAPGKQQTFSFAARGVAKGEHVVRSVLRTAGSERRVIVEDSIYVYETNESRVSENMEAVFPR